MTDQISIQLNTEELTTFKAYRQEFAQTAASIATLKEQQKEIFQSLFDKFGLDSKEHKNEIKAIKKSFALYVKQSADEELSLLSEAVELANL